MVASVDVDDGALVVMLMFVARLEVSVTMTEPVVVPKGASVVALPLLAVAYPMIEVPVEVATIGVAYDESAAVVGAAAAADAADAPALCAAASGLQSSLMRLSTAARTSEFQDHQLKS